MVKGQMILMKQRIQHFSSVESLFVPFKRKRESSCGIEVLREDSEESQAEPSEDAVYPSTTQAEQINNSEV